MIEVQLSDAYAFGPGTGVRILRKPGDGSRQILRLSSGSSSSRVWEDVPDLVAMENPVTFVLDDDEARALLEALMRRFQGASDMHTVRSDLLHERGRVDRLTDAVIRIAGGKAAL
jgi:hypothetical protein